MVEMPSSAVGAKLLERSVEFDRVRALIDGAASGTGRVLVLEGPAGIGKTAVIEGAVRLARDSGARTGAATGTELESDYAFGAVRCLLSGLVIDAMRSTGNEIFEGAAKPAAAVLGLADTNGNPHAQHEPAAVMHALYWLVAGLSERGPLLLVADDLHWFDPPSQRFLSYLSRRVDDLAVSLLMATRPVDRASGVLGGILADQRVPVRPIPPLTPHAVGLLVAARWEAAADARFVAACHDAGGGNPFLTEELLRALHDAGVEPTAEAAAAVASIGADGTRRQVLARLGRLPAQSVDVVRAIAVLGPDASVQRTATLLEGQDEVQVAAGIEMLAVAGLIVADQPVRFVHPLVHAAVYGDMPPAVRVWWHARAARALAAEGLPAERVAAHLMHVEPKADPSVVATLLAAADAATSRGAPDAASALYRRALGEPPTEELRHSILLRLGTAERVSGAPAAVEHLFEALAAAQDDAERVGAAWQLSMAMISVGRGAEAVTVLQRLRDGVAEASTQLFLDAAIVQTALASPAAAQGAQLVLQRFADLALSGQGDQLLPIVETLAGIAAWMTNRPASAIVGLVGRAFERDRRASVTGVPATGVGLALLGVVVEHPDALRIVDWVVERATKAGDVPMAALAMVYRAMHLQRRGQPLAAAADADASITACRLGALQQFLPIPIAVRAYCHLDRGELEEARRLLDGHGFGGPVDDTSAANSYVAHARGLLHLAQGRVSEAVADLRDAGRRLDLCFLTTPSAVPWRSDLAVALLAAGDGETAREAAAEELELAEAFGTDRCVGIALRAVGLVDPDRRAGEEALRDSVAALNRTHAPVELARSLVALGAMLRRRGARVEAKVPLARGLDVASSSGASAVAERARVELVAAGARPRRTRLVGVDSLTVTEYRTMELARGGATNKQIAQAMFVTVKTVETHLAHCYQKLGIAGRAELAGVLG